MNIFEAAEKGDLERVKYWIIDQKQDVNQRDSNGRTPLHLAALNGQLEVVKWLVLEGNAKDDEKDMLGKALIHYVVSRGELEVVKWLVLEGKAKVDEKDNRGEMPLHRVITEGRPGLAAFLGARLKQPLEKSVLSGRDPIIQFWFTLYAQLRSSSAKVTAVQLRRDLQAIGEYNREDGALYRYATIDLLLQSHCTKVANALSMNEYNRCLSLLVPWYNALSPADKESLLSSAINGGCIPFLKQVSLQLSQPQRYILEGIVLDKPQAEAFSLLVRANRSLTSVTFHHMQMTTAGYVCLFDALEPLKMTLEELTLSYCNIGGYSQVNLLQERLREFPRLRRLDLTGNRLIYNDIKDLLNYLRTTPQLKILEEVSVCHNLIEGCEISYLQQELPQLIRQSPVQRLLLTGNAFFSHTRDKDLLHLLTMLLVKSKLSIKDFLLTQYVSMKKRGDNEYCLNVLQANGQPVELKLNVAELQAFNQFKITHHIESESEMWKYLTQATDQRRYEIEDDLLETQISKEPTSQAQRALVKRLVDYHPDAPLKSYLATLSFYRSPPVHQINSLLFPDLSLTHDKWRVYLLARKSDGSEHAMLAYEGLTGYGQRFFRVAHLTVVGAAKSITVQKQEIVIDFFTKPLPELTTYLSDNYIIAVLPTVHRKQVKAMHLAIDEEKNKGVHAKYKFFISGSSLSKEEKEKKVQNCLKWAVDKIRDHLKIEIKIGGVYQPSRVVNAIIQNPNDILILPENNQLLHTIESKP